MKKIFWIRRVCQACFVILVLLGLHRTAQPIQTVLLLLAFVAGNFFCEQTEGYCQAWLNNFLNFNVTGVKFCPLFFIQSNS